MSGQSAATKRTEYVLGFLFTPERERVVLLEKARPAWQRGKLNGVGGHIEADDASPHDAMEREAIEEVGVVLAPWEHFATMEGVDWRVYVFRAFDPQADEATNLDDEPVWCVDPRDLPANVISNLRWLVPLALDSEVVGPAVFRYDASSDTTAAQAAESAEVAR